MFRRCIPFRVPMGVSGPGCKRKQANTRHKPYLPPCMPQAHRFCVKVSFETHAMPFYAHFNRPETRHLSKFDQRPRSAWGDPLPKGNVSGPWPTLLVFERHRRPERLHQELERHGRGGLASTTGGPLEAERPQQLGRSPCASVGSWPRGEEMVGLAMEILERWNSPLQGRGFFSPICPTYPSGATKRGSPK